MKIFILVFLFSELSLAQVPDGLIAELMGFRSSQQEMLPTGYSETLAVATARDAKRAQADAFKTSAAECIDDVKVDFANFISLTPSAAVLEFESGLIRIETISCLKSIDAVQLLSKTGDPDFRKRAFSTIKLPYKKERTFCEITDAPTIGLSNYCYDVRRTSLGRTAQVESFNVWNDKGAKYSSRVYYRYILESSQRFENHTVYHVVSYVRSNKLNSIQRFFAKQFIVDTQKKVIELLKKELE